MASGAASNDTNMAKKIPISVSEEWEQEINELAGLLGMGADCYGYIPKTLRFSITYALAAIKSHEKLIPALKDGELQLFFQTITKARNKRLLQEKAAQAQEMALKV